MYHLLQHSKVVLFLRKQHIFWIFQVVLFIDKMTPRTVPTLFCQAD
jgi:hypothetical protein